MRLIIILLLLGVCYCKEETSNELQAPTNLDDRLKKALLKALSELEHENLSQEDTFSGEEPIDESLEYSDKEVERAPASAFVVSQSTTTAAPEVSTEEETERSVVIIQKSNAYQEPTSQAILTNARFPEPLNETDQILASSNSFMSPKNGGSKYVNIGFNSVSTDYEKNFGTTKKIEVTTALPITTTEENQAKVEDLQFFTAPLVTAFTVHQNERGFPERVIPIYKPTQIPAAISQPSADEVYRQQLLEKQKQLELQVQLLQQQQKQQQELFYKQQQLFLQQQNTKQLEEQVRIQKNQEPFRPIINNQFSSPPNNNNNLNQAALNPNLQLNNNFKSTQYVSQSPVNSNSNQNAVKQSDIFNSNQFISQTNHATNLNKISQNLPKQNDQFINQGTVNSNANFDQTNQFSNHYRTQSSINSNQNIVKPTNQFNNNQFSSLHNSNQVAFDSNNQFNQFGTQSTLNTNLNQVNQNIIKSNTQFNGNQFGSQSTFNNNFKLQNLADPSKISLTKPKETDISFEPSISITPAIQNPPQNNLSPLAFLKPPNKNAIDFHTNIYKQMLSIQQVPAISHPPRTITTVQLPPTPNINFQGLPNPVQNVPFKPTPSLHTSNAFNTGNQLQSLPNLVQNVPFKPTPPPHTSNALNTGNQFQTNYFPNKQNSFVSNQNLIQNSFTQNQIPNNQVSFTNNQNLNSQFQVPVSKNRFNRHETGTGNFGTQVISHRPIIQQHQSFIEPQQQQPTRFFRSNYENYYNVNQFRPPVSQQLNTLLQQSGISGTRQYEDLNIISKVLSLNHFGNDNVYSASRYAEQRVLPPYK